MNQRMTDKYTSYARPAMWGFFICMVVAGVLVVVRMFIPSYDHNRWERERAGQRTRSEQVIRDAFQSRVDQLMKIADRASRDTSLCTRSNFIDGPAAYKTFQSLQSYRFYDYQTIDLLDSEKNVIAWNGPSIASVYGRVIDQDSPEPIIFVTQHGLRIYISVGKRLPLKRLMVLVSEPLEVNSPISNRFIQKMSFSGEMSQKIGTQVTFRLPHSSLPRQGEYSVPIVNTANEIIAEFFVAEITQDGTISSDRDLCTLFTALCLACACLFLSCAGILWIAKKHNHGMTTAVLILSLWAVRITWHGLNIPAQFVGGWLFNPNLYASPFMFGLCSSLGELVFTASAAAVSAWFFMSRTLFSTGTKGRPAKINLRIGRIGSLVLTGIISMLILWLFRGFGEAVRSFVFDSTIQYNNPSEILPDGAAVLIYFGIIIIGFSLLCVSMVLIYGGRKILFVHFSQSETTLRILIAGCVIICVSIFTLLDRTLFVPLLCSILFLAVSIVFVEIVVIWKRSGLGSASYQWKMTAWIVAGSFVIGAPLFHQELQQRERKEVEAVENDFLRPSDSWLTYMVQDGMRTSAENFLNHGILSSFSTAKENNLAFVLWTKSLMGKEGYSSALILYNQLGNEVDRFVVGMTKPEQQNILTKVFAGEEEAVHVADRTETKVLGKLYGAWTTLRDSSGQLLGSMAILVSEHQKAIFHEEDTEPLRQFGDRLENDAVREIAVHEFKNDSLVFSTGRKLYPEHFLSAAMDTELQRTTVPFLWKDIIMNGYKTQTVFSRDGAAPERIAAISLEKLDFRWDMFGYLKEFFVCLAILTLLGICFCIRKSIQNDMPALGFRGKLILGFALITLVPLIVLSYYNRQLIADRVQKQGEVGLYNELATLQDRISTYVSDEEDFVKGIDDDFCEALAAEYGIDFSVYRGASLQASSRSELYRASLLDGRLNGEVYASAVLERKPYVLAKEKIGSVEYVVGYTPLFMKGSIVGVLAIPTLNRQREIEAELSLQNVNIFGMYAVIFGIALAGGWILAVRFARPLHNLTHAVENVADGNLDINVSVTSRDEIGTLARSFNDMILKLRTNREELAKRERESAWKEMAKQVAHEIRNPLTPMKLSIQHLRQAFKDRAPEREEILQRVTQTVIDQIENLSRIATEFSNFAKFPERKYERIDMDVLVKDTINLFKDIQGITFVHQRASQNVKVVADGDQLRGVLINIIRNAIQAIEKEGTITISTSPEFHRCVIMISDTGPGIPDDIRAKIFEPNFSTKSEGMGIGLAIARRVIEDHGGTITCRSERGKGTTFEIRLPA